MFDITAMLQSVNDYVLHVVGNNQFAAGAILTTVTAGLLMAMRQVPLALLKFIRNQSITKLVVTNDGWTNKQAFVAMASFLKGNCHQELTRSFRLESSYDYDTGKATTVLAIGAGWHRIRYNGRTILAHRAEHANNQGDTLKENITLIVLGRSPKLLEDLVADCMRKAETVGVTVNEWNSKDQIWQAVGKIEGYNLDSIALDADIRSFFCAELDKFNGERDFLLRNGLPHKLTFMLHGLSGSGKTALVRALSGQFKLNLFAVNLARVTFSTNSLASMLRGLPRNSLLLMEDFDEAGGVASRGKLSSIHDGSDKRKDDDDAYHGGVMDIISQGDKSEILNFLDGVVPLDGVIIVLTTNVAVKLDAAMMRPGRIDHVIDLPQISVSAVREHLLNVWPDLREMEVRWSALPGCILYRIKRESLSDSAKAAVMINYYHDNPDAAIAEQQGELMRLDRIRALRERAREEAASDEAEKDKQVISESPVAA